MGIITRQGNLLAVSSGIVVHGCNCQGFMGGGVAKYVRNKWPDVHTAYRHHMGQVGLRLGDVNFVGSLSFRNTHLAAHLHAFSEQLPPGVIVANAMTQQDIGSQPGRVYVNYDAISAAFARVAIVANEGGLQVHFPLIGCGLAQGSWEDVSPRIETALGRLEQTLWVL